MNRHREGVRRLAERREPSAIVDAALSSKWFAWRGHSTAEIERRRLFAALGETHGVSTRV